MSKYKFLGCLLKEYAIGMVVSSITLPIKGTIVPGRGFSIVSHRENGIEVLPLSPELTRKPIIPLEKSYFKDKDDAPDSEELIEFWTAGQILLENASYITEVLSKTTEDLKNVRATDIMDELDDVLDKAEEYEFEMLVEGDGI